MDYNIDLKDQFGSYNQPPQDNINNQNIQQTNPVNEEYATQSNQEPQYVQHQENIKQEKQQPTGCMRFFNIQFYQKYFNVNQGDVVERLMLSFIPIKRQFIQKIRPNPDFYGPFWVLTTIIFLLSSTGNLSRYFSNWERDQYIFKLELVRYGVVIVYSFGFGIPILLYFVMKFLGNTSFSLPELICIYGYSFGCFIAVFLLCILPWGWLQWILMVYGMVNSAAFLILNMMDHLEQISKQGLYIVFGIIGLAQITLFLTFKLVFFDLIYESDSAVKTLLL